MTDKTEIIKKMDNSKLIDIVKNYKRYGYDVSLRDTAMEVLNERGIDEETLRLTGNLNDQKFESIQDIFNSFNKSSKTSFIFYGLFFLAIGLSPFLAVHNHSLAVLFFIIYLTSYAICIFFIIKSLISYSNFYKNLGKNLGSGPYLIFIISGIFAYFLVYFYFKKEMKDEMKMVN